MPLGVDGVRISSLNIYLFEEAMPIYLCPSLKYSVDQVNQYNVSNAAG